MNKEKSIKQYQRLYLISKITLIITTIAFVVSPFLFSLVLDGSLPNLKGFISGIAKIAPIYIPVAIVEFLVYVPMLGGVAAPLAFITGEVTGIKIPCVMNARDIAKVKAGTVESEVVSILSVATSSLVTMAVVFIGVLAMIPLTPILESPILAPAFEMVIPALFGALGFKYFIRSPQIAIIPLIVLSLLCIFVPSLISQTSILLIPAGGIALLVAYVLFRKGKLDPNETESL